MSFVRRARLAPLGRGLALGALLLGSAFASFGCAPEIGGRASFPVLSKATLPNYWEPVATVDEKRCTHVVLFFWGWGEDSNHEALVTDILSKHKGDAIADAELTFFSIPALVYHQNCARVTGTVVRRTAAGTAPASAPAKGEVTQ
ncbi:MAG TPA: hypothetical protein VM925_28365 [Labilithrix sp.]|jgi:hypothetical protein|nr:hypothetical protein [Labilithrix sp.]